MIPVLCDIDSSDYNEICLGSPLSTYYQNDDGSLEQGDYDTYPVLVNDHIVAIAGITFTDGSDSGITFGTQFAPNLQEAISAKGATPFAIIYKQGGASVLFSDDTLEVLYDNYGTPWEAMPSCIDPTTNFVYSSINAELQIEVSNPNVRQSTANELDMDSVQGGNTSCCSNGICWAACLAMMSKYHENTSYTSKQIHDKFGCLSAVSNYHSAEKSYLQNLATTA